MHPVLLALGIAPLVLAPRVEKRDPLPTPAASLLVTSEWLAAHIDDPDLVILEVSEDAEYKSGHIRRARPVDVMAFHAHGVAVPEPFQFVAGLEALGISNSSRIVLYGDYMATSVVWITLEHVGLGDQASVLDGGKKAWTESGHSLSLETPSYLAGKLVPQLRPGMFIDASLITIQMRDPSLALIDARSPEEFAGEPNNEMESPGHIPGAFNLNWLATLDSTGRLRPDDELRALFSAAGYAPGDRVVVYCTVGMRASHLYFVARHLDLRPQLYLGSMNDWTSNASRPVARAASQ